MLCLPLLFPLIAGGVLLAGGVVMPGAAGLRSEVVEEEEGRSPLVMKASRLLRRAVQPGAPRVSSPTSQQAPVKLLFGRHSAIRSYSLVVKRSGAVCRMDYRDGLGAPLLC